MITLITGAPGAGKTSFLIHLLLTDLHIQKRKIYAHGIQNLKIPVEPIYCSSNSCDVCHKNIVHQPGLYCDDDVHIYDEENQCFRYSPGSIIIIDECQHVFRPLSTSAKRPEYIRALETHRHHGYDFYLITQNPGLIDKPVRDLVSRHIHIKKTWLSTFTYEWPECKSNLSVSDAIKSKYSVPKKIYEYYKSAEVHTKHVHKKPFAFYAFFVMLFIVGFGIYHAKQRYSEITTAQLPASERPERAPASNGSEKLAISSEYTLEELRDLQAVEKNRLPFFCQYVAGTLLSCTVPRSEVGFYKSYICDNEKCKIYKKIT